MNDPPPTRPRPTHNHNHDHHHDPRGREPGDEIPPPPPPPQLEQLLDTHAPLSPVPLVPELQAFTARSLVAVWEEAEASVQATLPSPFWAYPWAAGVALARVVLDTPELVRGLDVFDFGAGGGIASLACARAGARRVVANDIDPWALAVTRIAAERQGLRVETLLADATARFAIVEGFDVVLCGDLGYDAASVGRERALLEHAHENGARVLVADAGRAYFDSTGFTLIARFDIAVPADLEGGSMRSGCVYSMA